MWLLPGDIHPQPFNQAQRKFTVGSSAAGIAGAVAQAVSMHPVCVASGRRRYVFVTLATATACPSAAALLPAYHKAHVCRMPCAQVPYFMCVRDGDVVSSFTASLSPEKLALLRRELAAHSAPSSSSSSSNNNKSGSAAAVECERALVAA